MSQTARPLRRHRLPVLRDGIAAADARLLGIVDVALAEAGRRAGGWLACRPGCSTCCVGPFPVTRLDAWRLRLGLDALRRTDPARARALQGRAAAAVERMRDDLPGDPVAGLLRDDGAALEGFCARHAALPCPVLDPATGTCDLYAHRPVTCRTYGPPVRFGDETADPCGLCFAGAPPEEIERCRVEPDPGDVEGAILRGLAAPSGEDGETLIAFAVARSDPA